MEHVQDNQKFPDFLKTVVGTWKESLIRTKDRFYVNFFNSGALTAGHDVFNNTITGLIDDTSGDVIYDGLPFFDTVHPDKVGGTYSNHTAARALNHDNLETTWETFTADNNRDERGNEIELMPNILLIPPYLKFTSDRILKSTNIPDSADNDINAMQNLVTPMVWQRLSDSDGWFLGALNYCYLSFWRLCN
jgi:phage major head subunit gpT-like protein